MRVSILFISIRHLIPECGLESALQRQVAKAVAYAGAVESSSHRESSLFLSRKIRQSIMRRTAQAFVQARFAYLIQTAQCRTQDCVQ
jgi:hypothetical protein